MKAFFAGVVILVMISACMPSDLSRTGLSAETGQITIARFPDQTVLGRYPMALKKGFSLSFIHSVSMTPVIDMYRITGTGRIIQTAEYFKAHGAGLPTSPAEPGGTSWEKTENWFILHMKRPINKLVVRTDKNYQNRLILPDRTIDLNQWEDQSLVITAAPVF